MKNSRLRQVAGKSVFLLWSTFCISAFIYFPGRVSFIHFANLDNWQSLGLKINRIYFLAYFIDLLTSLAGVCIFSIACLSLGTFLIKRITNKCIADPAKQKNQFLFMGTAFLVGHGIISAIFLTLAGIFHITPSIVILIMAIGLFSGIGQIKRFRPALFFNNALTKKERVIFRLSLSILLLSLMFSTARLSYDSVAVYFSDAKITALTNHIQFFTNDSFVVSVFQTAIQFTALIQVFGDQAARLFSWINGLVFILFSVALGKSTGITQKAQLILFVLLITSTAFVDLLGDGKVDLISSAPAIAAIYWMYDESKASSYNKSLLVLTGFLIGLAGIARPFNIILLGSFAIMFYLQKLIIGIKNNTLYLRRFTGSLFWVGIGVIGPGVYHLLANWVILGNPLAPLSNTANVDPSKWQWAFDPDQILIIRLFYPIVVTFLNSPQSLGNISPLFIAFLPALFFREIKDKVHISKYFSNSLVVTSILTLLLWIFAFFTAVEIRYVFFLWAILFIPTAEIIAASLDSKDRFFRISLWSMLTGLLLFINFRTIYISLDTYSPIDKQGNPQCFDSSFCEYLRTINEIANPGDRILTLSAYRYYLRNDLFACSTTHDEYNSLRSAANVSNNDFWLEVYRQGYKYIAYESEYATRHLGIELYPSPDNAPGWIKLQLIKGKPNDDQIAYRIHTLDPPLEVKYDCIMKDTGIWEVIPTIP